MKNMMERANKVLMNTYKRFPMVLERGTGATVWDINGKSYLDFVAGIAVCNLGHAHPRIAQAVARQAEKLLHVSNLYYTIPQIELAEQLTEISFADRVFFCNSGAEANEAAIKLTRRYFKKKGQAQRFKIITMEQSFHGRTMATLSATGQIKIRDGYDPILQGFEYIPFNDIEALEKAIDVSVCAVMLEPVQGEGGIRCPDPDYLKQVAEICRRAGILLIFDEIQTGMGRTGELFAYHHFGAAPDIMTLAKGLANGLPIGAALATEEVASAFEPGAHASTFGGTPVITIAALEVIKILTESQFLENVRQTSGYFRSRLLELQTKYPDIITDVRGIGLLLGLGLSIKGEPIVNAMMEQGIMINCVQENILRFIPPLIISPEEIDTLIKELNIVFTSTTTG